MSEKTILLVEDNPDDVDLAIRAFEKNNIKCKFVIVHDGEQALDYLFAKNQFAGRNIKEKPAVILLDIKLPKVDGLQVLREIKKNPITQTIPTVILTSSLEEQDLIESYTSGVNSYIRKPTDFGQFFETVQHMGNYWLNLNELPKTI